MAESRRPTSTGGRPAEALQATTIQRQDPIPVAAPLQRVLKEMAELPPEQRMPAIWQDMRDRWAAGEYVPVEEYLEQFQDLSADEVVDLIYAEFVLREESEAPLEPTDFEARFPEHAAALRRQLDVHGGLSTHTESETRDSGLAESQRPASPHSNSGPPERVGRYIIVSKVGDGGQSNVYLAIHPELKRNVVIKFGKTRMSWESSNAQHLVSEAQILAQLDHANLAHVYDLDFWDGFPYLVIEHVRGRSLSQYAEQEKPSPKHSAAIVAKIGRALAVAHQRGILHLDVKPSNILIAEGGEPRLIDFGLSRMQDAWYDERGQPGELSGTLFYMSPEQARGESSSVRQAADIFGLGAVLYYLLTGQPPYQPDTFIRLVEKVRRCEWDRQTLAAARVPNSLRRLCSRAMAADPVHRFARVEEFSQRLENYTSRSRLKKAALIAGGVAAASAIALVVGRDGQTEDHRSNNAVAIPAAPTPVIENRQRSPSLKVRVWDVERYLDLADAVPLQAGDELQLVADVPPGASALLMLLTSEGELKLLAQTQASTESQELRFPAEADQAVPLTGPPGTEFVMLCRRFGGPLTLDDVADHFAERQDWPALPASMVLRVGPEGIDVETRSRDFGPAVDRPSSEDVVRSHLEALRTGLAERCDHFEGLAFAHGD